MFSYTRSIINDTVESLKKAAVGIDVFVQLFYIAYLIFALCCDVGILVANVILLSLSLAYLVFFFITKKDSYTKLEKSKRNRIRAITRWLKRAVNFIVIVISVAELCISPSKYDNISIIFTMFMVLGFVFTVTLDLLIMVVSARLQLIYMAVELDVDNIKKPFTTPVNAVKRIFGKETKEKEYDSRKLSILDALKSKYKKSKMSADTSEDDAPDTE
jgi:hypothetical protein